MRLSPLPDEVVDEGGVNLTPLIDVVFVVLIMFIIIAPLIELDRVSLAVGGSEDAKLQPSKNQSVTIHVREDNTILVNHRTIKVDELGPILARLFKDAPKATPQLFHDEKATFGTYQRVKSSLEKAGFAEMDVILKHE